MSRSGTIDHYKVYGINQIDEWVSCLRTDGCEKDGLFHYLGCVGVMTLVT
jgi:hypothetical protein